MRGSSSRVRASGGRRGLRAQALILLAFAACGDFGDNITPRLVAARYVYEDGTQQIDRHQLFDLELGALCEPTQFSDGNTYCKPPAGEAFYTDVNCSHVVGRVLADATPPRYFATTYGLDSHELPSRLFTPGPPAERPQLQWKRSEAGCVAFPLDYGYTYLELGPEIDLARVGLHAWSRIGEFVVDAWTRADGLRVPTEIEGCTIASAPNEATTTCIADDAIQIAFFADSACTTPLIVDYAKRSSYLANPSTECTDYYQAGDRIMPSILYSRLGSTCVESSISPEYLYVYTAVPATPPTLRRDALGTGRLQSIRLSPVPLFDDLLHDPQLDADCIRDADGACIPATSAKVETWFSDPLCGTQIDLAMISTAACAPPTSYAKKGDTVYPALAPYAQQLYQLEPGDRCCTYNPPAPFVAHSIGSALGAEAFAHATLVIE